MRRARAFLAEVAAAEWLCLVAGLLLAWRYAWLMDDAFVCFRYVDNALFLKIGLVYNQGEFVEGYSSPAWTIVLLLLRALHLDYWHIVLGLGAVSYVLFWFGLVRLNRRLSPEPNGANIALIYLTANYAVLTYFTSGLESPLGQLIAIAFAHAILRPGARSLQLVLALSPLVRHELAVPLAICFAWIWWRTKRFPLWMAGMSILVNGGWVLFRVIYYADLFPNTFHLKNEIMPGQGWTYLVQTLTTYHFGVATLLVLLLPLIFLWKRGIRDRLFLSERGVMLLCALSVALYVVKIGGDARHYRYLAFSFCLAVCAWSGLVERLLSAHLARHRLATFLGAGALYALAASFYPPQLSRHPVTYQEEHAMVDKITDAAFHRHLGTLAPTTWRKGISISRMKDYARDTQPFRYEGIESMGWCVRAWVSFDQRVIHSYGFTDGLLARVDTPAGRPAHKLRLIPMSMELVEAQTALGWHGRGMYRAIAETDTAPAWIRNNLDAIELLERKIYNEHALGENLRLALTRIPRLDPSE